jgi:hypothetical protein
LASVASGATAKAAGVAPKPDEEIDLVIDDQFLRQPLRGVGRGAIIFDDHLDFPARHGVAVPGHVEADGSGDLRADRLRLPGHRQQGADLDGTLRLSWGGNEGEGGKA